MFFSFEFRLIACTHPYILHYRIPSNFVVLTTANVFGHLVAWMATWNGKEFFFLVKNWKCWTQQSNFLSEILVNQLTGWTLPRLKGKDLKWYSKFQEVAIIIKSSIMKIQCAKNLYWQMVMSPYEWNSFEWDIKQHTSNPRFHTKIWKGWLHESSFDCIKTLLILYCVIIFDILDFKRTKRIKNIIVVNFSGLSNNS